MPGGEERWEWEQRRAGSPKEINLNPRLEIFIN
jgi:hypothetical protein